MKEIQEKLEDEMLKAQVLKEVKNKMRKMI